MSRDESIAGFPLVAGDQFVLFSRSRAANSLSVNITYYDPKSDQTATQNLGGLTTSTSFAQQTTFLSAPQLNLDGKILVACIITAGEISSPVETWAAVEIFRNNQSVAFLCGGFLFSSHVPSWIAGAQPPYKLPLADAGAQGALFTFQGTVENGAGGAGDNTLTVTAATGGRVELLTFRIVNTDTAARASSLIVDDGTNILHLLGFNSALGAANNQAFPSTATTDAASFAANGARPGVIIAGANRLVGTLAAVAAAQGSSWAMTCLVWGAAPTCTLAGASTPTLTTNTSRVEGG